MDIVFSAVNFFMAYFCLARIEHLSTRFLLPLFHFAIFYDSQTTSNAIVILYN